jgi:hypothetical protein
VRRYLRGSELPLIASNAVSPDRRTLRTVFRDTFRSRREGKAVLSVEIDQAYQVELLIASGLLQEWDDGDKSKIEQATARLLLVLH